VRETESVGGSEFAGSSEPSPAADAPLASLAYLEEATVGGEESTPSQGWDKVVVDTQLNDGNDQ
jgi:hypothetical protein